MRSVVVAGAKCFVSGFAMVIFLTMNQGVARAETVTIHGITLERLIQRHSVPTRHLLGLTFNGTSFPNPIATVDTSTSSLVVVGPTINLGHSR
jgi:hypothetical protein